MTLLREERVGCKEMFKVAEEHEVSPSVRHLGVSDYPGFCSPDAGSILLLMLTTMLPTEVFNTAYLRENCATKSPVTCSAICRGIHCE